MTARLRRMGGRASPGYPGRSSAPHKCRSHLGFGLAPLGQKFDAVAVAGDQPPVVPQTGSMEHYATPDIFPLRELFHKRILPAWHQFSATSAPAGGSRRESRGWTPSPRSYSSVGRRSSGPYPPRRRRLRNDRHPAAPGMAPVRRPPSRRRTPWWWWPSTASDGPGRTPSGPSASCGTGG